jgi:hypothetical protein
MPAKHIANDVGSGTLCMSDMAAAAIAGLTLFKSPNRTGDSAVIVEVAHGPGREVSHGQ